MIARVMLVMLLMYAGVGCEKEIQEVRSEQVPRERLAGVDRSER